jgi:hypothetical protein
VQEVPLSGIDKMVYVIYNAPYMSNLPIALNVESSEEISPGYDGIVLSPAFFVASFVGFTAIILHLMHRPSGGGVMRELSGLTAVFMIVLALITIADYLVQDIQEPEGDEA